MKTLRSLLTLPALLVVAISFCSCRDSGTVASFAPAYNPLIESFSAGPISRNGYITVTLAEALAPEQLPSWSERVSVTPNTKGVWSIDTTLTVIRFTPEESLERGARYDTELSLTKLYPNKPDAEDFVFSVMTLPAVATATLGKIYCTESGSYRIEGLVITADSEDSDQLKRMAQWSESVEAIWGHSSDGRVHQFTINNLFPSGDSRTLWLSLSDAQSGYDQPQVLAIDIPAKDVFTLLTANVIPGSDNALELCFSQMIDPVQDVTGLITIGDVDSRINVDGSIVRLYYEKNDKDELELVVAPSLRSSKNETLKQEIRQKVAIECNRPGVRFVGSSTIVPSVKDRPNAVTFQARDLRAVTLRVMRIPEQNMRQVLQDGSISEQPNLIRTARPVACTTIFLDRNSSLNLDRWATYSLDLQKIIEPEPGALYYLNLSFERSYTTLDCVPESERITPAEAARADREQMESMNRAFDMGGYYWDMDRVDWANYSWSEKDMPCSMSYYYNRSAGRNLLVSDLGVIAKSGAANGYNSRGHSYQFRVHSIATTQPIANATIDLHNYQGVKLTNCTTDSDGAATASWSGSAPYYAVVSAGKERNYLLLNSGSELSTSTFDVSGEVLQEGVRGFVYTERGVWRPGDSIYMNLILNRTDFIPADHPVTVELRNPQGQLYQQRTAPHPVGSIYIFMLSTDESAPTGVWNATIKAGGVTFVKRLRIESIKPNRLSINLNFPAVDTILKRGRPMNATLSSHWLTGAPSADMKYTIDIELSSANGALSDMVPPGAKSAIYKNYTFDNPYATFENEKLAPISGTLNAEGTTTITAPIGEAEKPTGGMLKAELTTRVFEPSGESSIDVVSMLYSPFTDYVGISSPVKDRGQLDTDRNYDFGFVTVGPSAAARPGREIEVSVYKVQWSWWWSSDSQSSLARYVSDNSLSPILTKRLRTDNAGTAKLPVRMGRDQWGTYYITARDLGSGHTSAMMAYFDWPGYERSGEGSDPSAAMRLGVTLDKQSYTVGERARVSFPATAGSRAIISIETGAEVLSTIPVECKVENGMAQTEFTVESAMQPNAYVSVTLLQPYATVANDLPVRLYGVTPIKVGSPESHLYPTIKCPAEVLPESELQITVGEKNGRAMSYTLAIVDEGLLGLTRFRTPSPWDAFNARVALGVRTWDVYNNVLGAYGGRIEQMFAIGGDDALSNAGKNGARRFPPVVRYLGTFTLKKGASTTHKVKLPAYMGSVRVMVVAAQGDAWGSAAESVKVRAPIMLMGSAPRVVAPGDVIDVPATLMVDEDGVGDVEISVKAGDRFKLVGPATQKVNAKQKGEQMAYFRMEVLASGSNSDIRLTASSKSGGYAPHYSMTIPVRHLGTPTVEGQNQTLAAGKSLTIDRAFSGLPSTRKLGLEVSALPAMSLQRRLYYLENYPYGCIEQIVSGAFPLLYLPQMEKLTEQQSAAMRSKGEEVLRKLRNYSTPQGGMGYWMGESSVNSWGTIYALHFMTTASHKGYEVPQALFGRLKTYTLNMVRRWDASTAPSLNLTDAYGLYVLALAGQPEMGAMNRLRQSPELLSAPARSMLAAAYAAASRADIGRALLAGATPTVQDRTDYGSSLREQSMALIGAIGLSDGGRADALAKSVASELAGSEWLSTQSSAWAIISMGEYTTKNKRSDEMKFTWSAAAKQGEVSVKTPIWSSSWAVTSAKEKVVISNHGTGTLYVNTSASYLAVGDSIKPTSNGVSVTVTYLDGRGAPLDVNNLKRGVDFTSRVVVTNTTTNEIKDLMLSHPVPSGWEIMTPVGAALPDGVTYRDVRDAAVNSYIPSLRAGASVMVSLSLTSTYGGSFALPAIHCAAMYNGHLSGNSASGRVNVVK